LKIFEAQRRVAPGRFYQQLVLALTERSSHTETHETARRVVAVADQAFALREMDVVEEAGRVLMNLPLRGRYSSVGAYYLALSMGRAGNFPAARALLVPVADHAPLSFRARTMLALGAGFRAEGDSRSALTFHIEAARTTRHFDEFDPVLTFRISKVASILKGDDGDHKGALNQLETMLPLARGVGRHYPPLYSDYLNSYAVELAAVGRLEEASNVSRIVLASPYASAYPEWRETFDEIAGRGLRPSRSVVGFCETASKPENVVRLSEFARNEDSLSLEPSLGAKHAQVVDIEKWKKTHMPEDSKKDTRPALTSEQIAAMTPSDKRVRLGEILYGEDISEETLEAILAFAEDALQRGKARPKH